tara:strand:+ start:1263 stop:1391 length:129 start_codon:yes stop_codon:yes gene_type:complete
MLGYLNAAAMVLSAKIFAFFSQIPIFVKISIFALEILFSFFI